MCIIVYKPRGIPVDCQTLETCFENNPDGAGFMYPHAGRLSIRKGFFTFDDFADAWDRCHQAHGDNLPVVFHFRIATAGAIDIANCHPHRIADDLGFVHNGILSCATVPKDSAVSDTIVYRDRYLSRLTGRSLRNAGLFKRIGSHIGAGNKFVFMNGKGEVVICNEELGLWRDGSWYSNLSFSSRRGFPLYGYGEGWFCEYCGTVLDTPGEISEGVCHECLAYFESDSSECGGCRETLFSAAHRELGWCDDCGFEIYGGKWSVMLRAAAGTTTAWMPHRF